MADKFARGPPSKCMTDGLTVMKIALKGVENEIAAQERLLLQSREWREWPDASCSVDLGVDNASKSFPLPGFSSPCDRYMRE
eukprot:CAMPEP_0169249350 /NCGR_PEP_ID=MMETSP1016-20121227/36349_1 /TAXON_ID=342587 /ORGANISM="Karlodinium micrum, Strain CCMP2283" /LENGTH=81 /DNA_ID=CAMNT_0009330247 /DNA_START=112 /DNA_END=354 /DNA_ORIENTATION=+